MTVPFSDGEFNTHLFSYRHAGAEWTLEIRARDAQDAKERLKALPLARYDGRLVAKFPTKAASLVKAGVWLRNFVFGGR
jgi:hypothetical protein